ncbi:MAG: hypothetical protein DRN14_04580 [Thermoplasmata archaeon]|nr:MAG: hypothetical protein DRN14_04580 [Thermoplasmata archaeon]
MTFDLSTAKPVAATEMQTSFDISSAVPVSSEPVFASEQERQQVIADLPELEGIVEGEAFRPEIMAALTATNPAEMGEILRQAYPQIGVVQTPEGEFIAVNNETGAMASLNKPGVSKVDILQGLGIMSLFFPAGKIAAAPAALGQKMAVGAAASGATQAAIEGGQALAGGEINPEEVGMSAALGGAGELVAPAISKLRGAKTARSPAAQQTDESLDIIEEITGSRPSIYPAQREGTESLLTQQRYVAQQPETSKMAMDALKKQNQEVYDATAGVIDTLAREEALEGGVERIYKASRNAIKNAKGKVKDQTRPLYDEAWAQGADPVPVKESVIGNIDLMLNDLADGSIKNNVMKAKRAIESAKTFKGLQSAKETVDDLIDSAETGTKAKSYLTGIKSDLLESMTEVNPQYRIANDEYARLSAELVDPLQGSLVGRISRVNDDNLQQITTKIFDAKEVNPKAVTNAKKVIESVDPQAWNDILRVEAQKRIGGISDLIMDTAEATSNRPADIRRALYGNPEKRRVFLSAMDTEQRANFRALEDILIKASTGRGTGSPTNIYGQIAQWLKGGAARTTEAARSPVSTATSALGSLVQERNTKALATALFDPDYTRDLSKVLQGKNTPTKTKAFMQLLDDISRSIQTEQEQEESPAR